MDRDAVADLCTARDQAFGLTVFKFRQVRRRWEIEVHYFIPFFMGPFRNNVKSSFRSFPVTLYHFVIQRFTSEHRWVGSIPTVFVIHLEFVITFDDDNVDVPVWLTVKEPVARCPVMGVPEGDKGE